MSNATITKKDAVQELVQITGEDAGEFEGLPLKALVRLIASEKARVEAQEDAKAKAEAATQSTGTGTGRKRTPKGPQYTKRARATRRWLLGDSEAMVSQLADLMVMDPTLSEEEARDMLGVESKQNGYVNAIRATIRSLYSHGALDPAYSAELFVALYEQEESE
jgi:hypothetical protein